MRLPHQEERMFNRVEWVLISLAIGCLFVTIMVAF